MNLFSYIVNFRSEESCRIHIKNKETKSEFIVNAVANNIFG